MIKRIQKIINVGKFANCCVPGCEFGKETIIHGFNTHGKSTLTAIFRSIQCGNNDIVIGRKTFGASGNQNIEIDFEENGVNDKYIFQNGTWNKNNPNILIFDSRFIADNIFNGESITFDQQKNLNSVIIGEEGNRLNEEINELQKRSDDLTRQKTDKTREFSRHFPGFNIDKFREIPEDGGIDNKINEKDKEIKFESEKEVIKDKIKFYIQTVSGIRFSIRDVLVKTLDAKQDEIDKHVASNFSRVENAWNFLDEGLNLLKEKPSGEASRSCVFCGQSMGQSAEKLISSYSAFFKGGYRELQRQIFEDVDYFKDLNLEVILQNIASYLENVGLDVSLSSEKIAELVGFKKEFEKELDKKRDLNYKIDFTAFDCLETEIKQVVSNLLKLEQEKVNVTSQKNIATLNNEKTSLELIKKRWSSIWINFFKDVDGIDRAAELVRIERDKKRKELEEYSTKIFSEHRETINSLCRDMGADFEIEDFKPLKKIIGKEERIFAIKFFGTHKIDINNNDERMPNFCNTLSESDKRLLAFAFFVSLLVHDKNLDSKIIVFDDPMSSFDSERRRKTLHFLSDASCKYVDTNGAEKVIFPKQKIILTHEDYFAKDLKNSVPNACSVKIEEYAESGNKRSKIAHTDFFKDFPDDDISYRIDNIKDILDKRLFTIPFEEDCRIVLEHIFKRKYHLYLKDDISQKKSIRTFTATLSRSSIGNFNDSSKLTKFTRLCNDLNIELHDNNNSNSNGDKASILNDFFECLESI
jgi:wobble nucleotide-excising tRNase